MLIEDGHEVVHISQDTRLHLCCGCGPTLFVIQVIRAREKWRSMLLPALYQRYGSCRAVALLLRRPTCAYATQTRSQGHVDDAVQD